MTNEIFLEFCALAGSHVRAFYQSLTDSLEYCKEESGLNYAESFIDKGNISEVFTMFHDFMTSIELDFNDVVDERFPEILRRYSAWCNYQKNSWFEKDPEKLTEDVYDNRVFEYVKFLMNICEKYNVYVYLTKEQQDFLKSLPLDKPLITVEE